MKLSAKITMALFVLGLSGGFMQISSSWSQDYVDPSATESPGPSADPSVKPVETEYEKRLREEIERQLEAQKNGTPPDTPPGDGGGEEDFAEEEESSPAIACGTTLNSTVSAIVKASGEAEGATPQIQSEVGKRLSALIKNIWEGYGQLPSKLTCEGGAEIRDLTDDAQKQFQKDFIAACRTLTKEVQSAIEGGGLPGFNQYIGNKMTTLSEASLDTAKAESCGEKTPETAQPGSGSIVDGSGSGGNPSGTSEDGYMQNYPPGHELENHGNHSSDTATEQTPAPLKDWSDDPPGMNYPEGSLRLRLRGRDSNGNYSSSPDRIANCVFFANGAVVQDCKQKLDGAMRDWRYGDNPAIKIDHYIMMNEICKRAQYGGCDESGSKDILITSGYRNWKTNATVGSSNGSQHPRMTASDYKMEGVGTGKLHTLCKQVRQQQRGGRGGCGLYGTWNQVDARDGVGTW